MLANSLPTEPQPSPIAFEIIPSAELQACTTKHRKLLLLSHHSEEDPLGCVNSFTLWVLKKAQSFCVWLSFHSGLYTRHRRGSFLLAAL